jgi:hypothetical protein
MARSSLFKCVCGEQLRILGLLAASNRHAKHIQHLTYSSLLFNSLIITQVHTS